MKKFSFRTADVQGTANRLSAIDHTSKYSNNTQSPYCPFIVNKNVESADLNTCSS